MVLLATFNVLLYRYTKQADIVVGSPIANRNHPQIEKLIGFFVNTLALRTQLHPEISFKCLLEEVKRTTLEAYEHQDIPFERLVETLKVERSLSHSPVFQVMLILQNNPEARLRMGNIEVMMEPLQYEFAKFDLTLDITETEEGSLHGSIEYALALFEHSTIERMAQHFENLLTSMLSNFEKSIQDINYLIPRETEQLLLEWNQTEHIYPKDQTLPQLFEAQSRKTPNHIAVIFEEQHITYQELNEKANQLAHYLIQRGVKSETKVAIMMERSIELIIGILGILKAGGAYVPLDPSYPEERLSYMLEDSGAEILVTTVIVSSQATNLLILLDRPQYHITMVFYDELQKELRTQSKITPVTALSSQNLAYVIYTSGSTGKPKGVLDYIKVWLIGFIIFGRFILLRKMMFMLRRHH